MSSWPHGDPATPVLHAYRGDPAKIRLIHAGVKETHVFHLHVHQWRLDPEDPNSMLIDSISFGPQEVYTIEPLFGAGNLVRIRLFDGAHEEQHAFNLQVAQGAYRSQVTQSIHPGHRHIGSL